MVAEEAVPISDTESIVTVPNRNSGGTSEVINLDHCLVHGHASGQQGSSSAA